MAQDWVPSAAVVAASAIAIVVRASLADQPRPWRLVVLDSAATAGLAYAAHNMLSGLPEALGGPLSERFVLGASIVLAVMGWAALTRWAWLRWGAGAASK